MLIEDMIHQLRIAQFRSTIPVKVIIVTEDTKKDTDDILEAFCRLSGFKVTILDYRSYVIPNGLTEGMQSAMIESLATHGFTILLVDQLSMKSINEVIWSMCFIDTMIRTALMRYIRNSHACFSLKKGTFKNISSLSTVGYRSVQMKIIKRISLLDVRSLFPKDCLIIHANSHDPRASSLSILSELCISNIIDIENIIGVVPDLNSDTGNIYSMPIEINSPLEIGSIFMMPHTPIKEKEALMDKCILLDRNRLFLCERK